MMLGMTPWANWLAGMNDKVIGPQSSALPRTSYGRPIPQQSVKPSQPGPNLKAPQTKASYLQGGGVYGGGMAGSAMPTPDFFKNNPDAI